MNVDHRFNQTQKQYAADDLETMSEAHRYQAHVFGLIRPHVGQHVLEVGCGIGTMSQTGIGTMTGLGIGSIGGSGFSAPPVQSSPSPFLAPVPTERNMATSRFARIRSRATTFTR